MASGNQRIHSFSNLDKEAVAEQYFRSVRNPDTRRNHTFSMIESGTKKLAQPPEAVEIERDFRAWYAGFASCVRVVDPQSATRLPDTRSMVDYITSNFEKESIAA
jgi:hypothetical protein